MSAPAALRLAVLALLVALVLFPNGRETQGGGEILRVDPRDHTSALRAALDEPPALAARLSTEPPSPRELELLEAVAHRAPVVVALPDAAPRLRVLAPPSRPRVGRWSALQFAARGEPGDTMTVTLSEGGTALDTLAVAIGPSGEATAAFRMRPARAGWHDWRVDSDGEGASSGGWVAEGRSLRILLASGPPDWETRFVARALEEVGATVVASQLLGRGLHVGEPFRDSPEALRGYDLLIIAAGAPLTATRLALLERYVAEDGGGVLVAGAPAALPVLRLADGFRRAGAVRGDALRWALPAEMIPLPNLPIESAAEPLEGVRPGTLPVASAPGADPLFVLRAHGRGRVAALGLRESWRWRMEGGRVAEHRQFWGSLADWLAGGLRDPVTVRLSEDAGMVGAPVELAVHSAAANPPTLLLTRPNGSADTLALAADARERGAYRATFLPIDGGVHLLSTGNTVRGAYRATEPSSAQPDAIARLALLAARSGGAALPPDSMGPWLDRWRAEHGASDGHEERWRLALLALVAATALAEWVLRRTRGLR